MVDEIDLLKICKDWHFHCVPDAKKRKLSDADINLGLLKAKAVNLEWTDVSHRPIYCTWPETIDKRRREDDDELVSHVSSRKICEDSATVTITQGVIKGLNKYLKLPLSGCKQRFAQKFGRCLYIDPSQTCSDIPVKNLEVEMDMEKESRRGDKVVVKAISYEYTAYFACNVEVTGVVPSRSGLQHTLAGMLQDLRGNRRYRGKAQWERLQIYDKAVVLEMAGEVELCWEDYLKQSWQ